MVKKINNIAKDENIQNNDIDNGKPQPIAIDNKEYYVGSELMEYDKVYFTGCSRTIRKIIDLKKIPQDKYAYGNNNIKKGGWRLSDNQAKPPAKANLLLLKDWVESNVPKMMDGLDEKEVKEKYDCPEAPNIIDLDDNEKFKDEKGNPLEIETRGERSIDGIYFLVSDVEKAFGMDRINDTLTHKNSDYTKNEHFKYFICNNRKRLFLTLTGLQKVIITNRTKKFKQNQLLIVNWVKNIFPNYNANHIAMIKSNQQYLGVVYIISHHKLDFVKIGYWTSDIDSLRSRYIVYYGSDINIYYEYFDKPGQVEKEIHTYFREYNKEGELFMEEYIDDYKLFLNNHKEKIDINKVNKIKMKNKIEEIKDIEKMEKLRKIENNKADICLDNNKVIKEIYNDRKETPKEFVKWATETLFTVQMGDDNEKQELASNLIGIPTKSLKQVLSKSASSVPCLYHFSLGIAKNLRKVMKIPKEIPDNYIITKYGFTEDLDRRTKEHEKTYGKIKGVNLELMTYIYIDPKYLAQAEIDIKIIFANNEQKINYENYKELFAIDPKHKGQIIKVFKMIGNSYAGCVKDFLIKTENLKNEIKVYDEKINVYKEKINVYEEKINMYEERIKVYNEKINTNNEKHQKEIEKLKSELKYQIEITKHQAEIAKQQMELLKQKMEIEDLKNKKSSNKSSKKSVKNN